MSTLITNPNATKTTWCPSCKAHTKFGINAGAWCCEGCGWVKDVTKSDMHLVRSRTIELAEYLRTIGYPVLQVEPETKHDAGRIVLIDTNPTMDPKKSRRVLGIQIDITMMVRRSRPSNPEYTVHAVKYTTNRKVTGNTVFYVDDLMDLGTNIDTQVTLARLVDEDLNLKMPHTVFDLKLAYMKDSVLCAKQDLADAEKELGNYLKEGDKTK